MREHIAKENKYGKINNIELGIVCIIKPES